MVTSNDELTAKHREKCALEIPYVSRQEAKHQAKRVTQSTGLRSKVYECQVCGYFHTTSLPTRAARRARQAVKRELTRAA